MKHIISVIICLYSTFGYAQECTIKLKSPVYVEGQNMTYVFQIDNSTNNDFYFAETALFYQMIIFSDKNEFPEKYQSVGTRRDSAAAGKDNRHIVKKHSTLEIKLRHPDTWVYKTTKGDNYKLLVRYFFSSKKKFQGRVTVKRYIFYKSS